MKFNICKYLLLITCLTGLIGTKSYSNIKQLINSDTALIDKGSFDPIYKYMASTVRYPASARESGTQGTIILLFDLTEKGTIANAVIENAAAIKKTAHGIDDEALHAINGFKDKKLVLKAGSYQLPVTFKLQGLTAPLPLNPERRKQPNCLFEIIVSGY